MSFKEKGLQTTHDRQRKITKAHLGVLGARVRKARQCKLDINILLSLYSKTYVKQQLKIDKTKTFMTHSSLMKVKSIAKCSLWSIPQYF